MTGTSMSIWTIMISIAFVLNPIKSIFAVNQGTLTFSLIFLAFVPFENKSINLLLPKLTYMFFNSLILAAALYKFSGNQLRLIASDGNHPGDAVRLGGPDQ